MTAFMPDFYLGTIAFNALTIAFYAPTIAFYAPTIMHPKFTVPLNLIKCNHMSYFADYILNILKIKNNFAGYSAPFNFCVVSE